MEVVFANWQFISDCMECAVIGSIERLTEMQNAYIEKFLLTRALEIIEIAEKQYNGIVMCKKPDELINNKNEIKVGFCIIFESTQVMEEFISSFKNQMQ